MTNRKPFYSGVYRSELSFVNKLRRFVWGIVWCCFFRPSPRSLFRWRRFLLNRFGAKLAHSAVVYPSVKVWAPWNLEMGGRSVLGDYVDCYSVDQIVLEDDVTVSQYVFLCSASHDIESVNRDLVHKPIRLEQGSWVFAGAFIGMGVIVGEGAVVAARSVVVKDVAPYTVVGGNPAKFIKEREATWVMDRENPRSGPQ
jgi:putative colanic acid biosynthesis acetyltransferase WcaF